MIRLSFDIAEAGKLFLVMNSALLSGPHVPGLEHFHWTWSFVY